MYAYPIEIHHNDNGATVATCLLVPGFRVDGTSPDDLSDERLTAALLAGLEEYQAQRGHEAIPVPARPLAEGQRGVHLPILAAAKVELWNAMIERGITRSELARRLDMTPVQTGRLTSLQHGSQMHLIERALLALGLRIRLTFEKMTP